MCWKVKLRSDKPAERTDIFQLCSRGGGDGQHVRVSHVMSRTYNLASLDSYMNG